MIACAKWGRVFITRNCKILTVASFPMRSSSTREVVWTFVLVICVWRVIKLSCVKCNFWSLSRNWCFISSATTIMVSFSTSHFPTVLQQAPSIPPPFNILSRVGSDMHLHTSAMLPHVPLVQFHDYSTLVAPQTLALVLSNSSFYLRVSTYNTKA